MCNVKIGAEVETQTDLQNLVTGVILSQQDAFNTEKMVDEVRLSLGSSHFNTGTTIDVERTVAKTISVLQLARMLTCLNGTYYANDALGVI